MTRTRTNDSLDKVRALLSQSTEIVLCGHMNPDGDAIGASFALAASLRAAGKKVQVLLESYSEKYQLIPGAEMLAKLEDVGTPELFISLDCGDMGRITWLTEVFQRSGTTLNIDHHNSNSYFGDLNYVDVNASSTCELVFEIIRDAFPVDDKIATALYAGLVYDTGGFRHTSTTPKTMEIAAVLLGYDVPFTKIYNVFFDSRTFSELKIMSRAFDKAEILHEDKVILSSITMEEITACQGNSKELDAIINFLKGVGNTKIACFLYEKTPLDVKVSFRSNEGYDVCALAQVFGGGGHIKAAGCTIEAPIAQVREMVLAEIEKML